ncbi:putative HTH-type transcriptional regulator YusO [Streptomyces sp. ADI96-02]|uniref:MarR family winged helix-turn-helix transcriptional regulator n=1 Tax=unclassified Streptomyces TaxID=2593676 RepID=UPI000F558BBB|nr:MarR family transcriptional regulator [Streptomyces sp. ADI96-02]RPK64595.1 putative HTH-type transcriptional regulator YusO [Streptomyces sp. ADI96-02]
MGVERFGSDDGLHEVARIVRVAVDVLDGLWTNTHDGPSAASMSASQLRALTVLDRHEGINLSRLGAKTGAAPSSVSRLCDRLEALGFVQRSSSRSSRREVELWLTSQGRSHLERMRAGREEKLASVLETMTPDARRGLAEGLEVLCAAVLAGRPDASSPPGPSGTAHSA